MSKKEYSTPMVEKIEFDYREQILTSGNSNNCDWYADTTSTRNTDDNDGVCRIYDRTFYPDL